VTPGITICLLWGERYQAFQTVQKSDNAFLKQTESTYAIILLSTTANHHTIRGYLCLLMIMPVKTAAKHPSLFFLRNQIKMRYGK